MYLISISGSSVRSFLIKLKCIKLTTSQAGPYYRTSGIFPSLMPLGVTPYPESSIYDDVSNPIPVGRGPTRSHHRHENPYFIDNYDVIDQREQVEAYATSSELLNVIPRLDLNQSVSHANSQFHVPNIGVRALGSLQQVILRSVETLDSGFARSAVNLNISRSISKESIGESSDESLSTKVDFNPVYAIPVPKPLRAQDVNGN